MSRKAFFDLYVAKKKGSGGHKWIPQNKRGPVCRAPGRENFLWLLQGSISTPVRPKRGTQVA
jgi:hypothetical protein